MSVDKNDCMEELFHAALAKPPHERERFVFEACRGDWAIYNETLTLLRLHDTPDAVLDRDILRMIPTRDGTQTRDAGSLVTTMGRYQILEVLGEGGMGIVYLANQTAPIKRRVALKVVKLGMESNRATARFETECQVLALMNHRNIARMYEAGSASDSRMYFAMEYVPGLPITEHCDNVRLGIRGRLRLFIELCRAVQHAHQKGIIHRDIKPSNVIVSDEGGEVTPKIIDFGVAKVVDRPLAVDAHHTLHGSIVGSYEYMSPEQADPRIVDIDTRADIYSLGVLMYELLTGVLPIDIASAWSSGYSEIERRIRDEEPTVASRRVQALGDGAAAVAESRATSPSTLVRCLQGDLDWILARALQKDRHHRYAAASEFAADIERYLSNEPVHAGPPSRKTSVRKFIRRHRALVVGVGAVIAALTLGLVTSTALYLENRKAMALAQAQRDDILRLSDVNRLAACIGEAGNLVPPRPERIPAMQAWLDGTARELGERLLHHRSMLRELESRAVGVEDGRYDSGEAATFHDSEDQFHYDILSRLVADLETFVDPDPHVGAVAGVRERLAFARDVYDASITSHREAWDSAVASIADTTECPMYGGLRIAPQLGLVPIGRDAITGLWEFAHLRTGEIPARGPNGRLVMDERGAIVLVLIPGGCFWMGAERTATSPQSRDRIVHAGARDDEAPVNRVCLDPFFLSKFEMTQSQWLRVTGDNPSRFATDRRRPVEEVDWTAAEYTCRAVDLSLPTEAQWEYAARGGVATPWWSGTDKRSLAGAANLMDASSRDRGRPPEWPYEPWHDGYAGTAPVGAMQPNGFGLYDVIGNVWEWCRDTYGPYTEPARIGDGLREPAQSRERILRGGDFNSTAEGARVTRRVNLTPIHSMRIGLRPARRVEAAEGT